MELNAVERDGDILVVALCSASTNAASSMSDSITPPKIAPCGFVWAGIMTVRIATSLRRVGGLGC
ncbi:hypothetical protein ABWH91_00775 [Phycisphaerales bacterium ac7]